MEDTLQKPQRQSSIGILILFFDTIQKWGRGLWPIAVIWLFKVDQINKLYLLMGTVLVVLIIGIVAYLKYLNFTFYLDEENGEFIISEGIFNKTKTIIQLNRIQQVNISQSIIQRFIGLYELDVDTAGSAKKEGQIKAISHSLALTLKARLMDNEKKEISPLALDKSLRSEVEEKLPFIKISLLSLLKVGITSNYVKSLGLILAFFATAYENSRGFIENSDFDEKKIDAYLDRGLAISSFTVIAILILCSILIFNTVRTVFKYFNYKITKQNGSLLLSYGLLSTKSTILKPEKVQIVTVSKNYFQRKMNILELKIKQATAGQNEEGKSMIEIPGCNASEYEEILRLLFKNIPQKGLMLKPNVRKLIFSVLLSIVLPLTGFFAIANYVYQQLLEYTYLLPMYVLFVGAIVYCNYINYRLFINNNCIIKQSGAWDVDNTIIEPLKIQAITTSQLFWHKRIDIGSITIHTAGGNVSFQLGNFTMIKQYVNLWLYEMETSNSNWM